MSTSPNASYNPDTPTPTPTHVNLYPPTCEQLKSAAQSRIPGSLWPLYAHQHYSVWWKTGSQCRWSALPGESDPRKLRRCWPLSRPTQHSTWTHFEPPEQRDMDGGSVLGMRWCEVWGQFTNQSNFCSSHQCIISKGTWCGGSAWTSLWFFTFCRLEVKSGLWHWFKFIMR